jgi:hypothetical protein
MMWFIEVSGITESLINHGKKFHQEAFNLPSIREYPVCGAASPGVRKSAPIAGRRSPPSARSLSSF